VNELDIRLRAVTAEDVNLFRRLATEPGLVGPNWYGFRDAEAAQRRFDTDGWLGPEDGRLMVAVADDTAGLVSWFATGVALTKYWNIGISLLPEWRGRGVGWRAQALLCDYLFAHTHSTFGDELMSMRLDCARRLLSDARFASLKVSDVAARCGFLEPSHFARRFRRAYGAGPTEFRETALRSSRLS